MKSLVFFTFIGLLSLVSLNKIVTIAFDGPNTRSSIDLKIDGKDIQTSYFNTFLSFSIFKSYGFEDDFLSNSLEPRTFYMLEKYDTHLYKSNVTIENAVFPDFYFFILVHDNYEMYYEDRGIALGYKFEDVKYSLVYLLYSRDQISNLMFAFTKKEENVQLYLGGVPNNEHLENKYHGFCQVNGNYTTWGCELRTLTFDGVTYHINKYAAVNSAFNRMVRSNELFEWMGKILKNEIDQNKCDISTFESESKFYVCNNEIPQFKNNLSVDIQIGDMIISVPFVELFEEKDSTSKDSRIYSNAFKNYGYDHIILGNKFLKLFNYSIFDYENKQIKFYSNEQPIKMINESSQSSLIKGIFVIVIILCIGSIATFAKKIYKKELVL